MPHIKPVDKSAISRLPPLRSEVGSRFPTNYVTLSLYKLNETLRNIGKI